LAIMSLTANRSRPPVSIRDQKGEHYKGMYFTVVDHAYVFLLRGTLKAVSPVHFNTLSTMQI
jgi:hypothetical protein